jgi:hypothetical protein
MAALLAAVLLAIPPQPLSCDHMLQEHGSVEEWWDAHREQWEPAVPPPSWWSYYLPSHEGPQE